MTQCPRGRHKKNILSKKSLRPVSFPPVDILIMMHSVTTLACKPPTSLPQSPAQTSTPSVLSSGWNVSPILSKLQLSSFSVEYLFFPLQVPKEKIANIYCAQILNSNDDLILFWLSCTALICIISSLPSPTRGFPAGSDSKESACNAGDLGSIPELGRSPREGNGNPLQYSCLENLMNRGAWRATVHGAANSWTWLNDQHFHAVNLQHWLYQDRECPLFDSEQPALEHLERKTLKQCLRNITKEVFIWLYTQDTEGHGGQITLPTSN